MVDQEFHKKKAIEDMKSASVWIIKEGMNFFSENGKDGIFRKLFDEYTVQLWVDPWIESDTYIACFAIKTRGIHYEILNLHRENLASGIYEFWIVKVTGMDWSGESNRVMFYVTETDSIYGRRKILKANDQFIASYQVNAEKTIHFPKDDPEVLFDMEAWLFPDNFNESNLKNIKAVMENNGDIELVRID